jgi:hypothetical protein
MTIYLSNGDREFTFITAIPFWLATIVTAYYLTTLYIDKTYQHRL